MDKNLDGGYYAIKGFEYQIDKAILEILNEDNEGKQINIERIQDIDSGDFVMQVKYKETQKFTPSGIKEPVIQLLHEFKKDPTKKYYLYSYFGDLNGYDNFININKAISIENLDKILGNKKDGFTITEREEFVEKFCLDFAPVFQEQFKQVISKLQEQQFISNSVDEAVFYYANITDFLRKLVVNSIETTDRTCTKKQVFDYIRNGKKLVFNSAFKEYKGEEQYFKFVKKKFVRAKKNQENFVFFGDTKVDGSVSVGKLILDIVDKYYERAMYDTKPITFIIPDNIVREIKKDLIAEGIIFNDGYEHVQFNENIFFEEPIKNRNKAGNGKAKEGLAKISYRLRLLSISKFNQITDCRIRPKIIYYFDSDISSKFELVSFLKIDKLNTKQINDIFTF